MVSRTIAIIQARTTSVRLPGKVMYKINGTPLIEILHKRLKRSKKLDNIVIATTQKSTKLINFLRKKKILYFFASETNVLNRYYKAAIKYKADKIVRITADGILADGNLIDEFIKKYEIKNVDYLSNTEPVSYPDGLDIEIFNFKSLKFANFNSKKKYDKEHVTPFIRNHKKFKKLNILNNIDYSNLRLTLDELEDYDNLKKIFRYFKPDIFLVGKKL